MRNHWLRLRNLLLEAPSSVGQGRIDSRWCRSIPVEVGCQHLDGWHRSNSCWYCTRARPHCPQQYCLHILSERWVSIVEEDMLLTVCTDLRTATRLPGFVGAGVSPIILLVCQITEAIVLTCPSRWAARHTISVSTRYVIFFGCISIGIIAAGRHRFSVGSKSYRARRKTWPIGSWAVVEIY